MQSPALVHLRAGFRQDSERNSHGQHLLNQAGAFFSLDDWYFVEQFLQILVGQIRVPGPYDRILWTLPSTQILGWSGIQELRINHCSRH